MICVLVYVYSRIYSTILYTKVNYTRRNSLLQFIDLFVQSSFILLANECKLSGCMHFNSSITYSNSALISIVAGQIY